MKKYLPLLILLGGLGYLASALFPVGDKSAFKLDDFGRLPVLVNGRIKPLDTVARTSLLTLQGRQRVSDPTVAQPMVDSPIQWLADVFFNPTKADDYPTFRVSASDSPDLVALMGLTDEQTRITYDDPVKRTLAVADFLPGTRTRFSFNQLKPKLAELDRQAQLAEGVDEHQRTQFQKQVLTLRARLLLYLQLQASAQMPDSKDFLTELQQFERALPTGVTAILAKQAKQPYNESAVQVMKEMADRFSYMEQFAYLRTVPPDATDSDPANWRPAGPVLLDTFGTGRIDATVMDYAKLGHAWRNGDAAEFNRITLAVRDRLVARFAVQLHKGDIEMRFNAAEPFYRSMTLYACAFFLAIFSWLKWPEALGRSAFYLILLAFVATSAGIITRMWLEGRPPVTNLYSSALFIGWGSVGLCLVLEKTYRNAIGSVAAGMIGFVTLLIAHHLSLSPTLTPSGDTLEMMRAVLDTNLWLATHVVIVTTGYASTFLAGFLAIIYILRGTLTRSLDKATADSLNRMVYGIVCFATLCSLVGTVLGGIWADQSWGRFWGWDPKENGALMIVIWNAVILHARYGGLVRARGLMALAVFGNIVTSWSWFGTNMLGVGLHSYGFMDAAFWWLIAFVISQLAIIALAVVPLEKWKSFRTAPATA